jgi:predicted N-acetyltransferase YhbS
VTFGPVSVDSKKQGQGIGQYLIKHFFAKAKQMGFKAVIIQGYPHYYKRLGFVNSNTYKISDEEGNFSAGLLVHEL